MSNGENEEWRRMNDQSWLLSLADKEHSQDEEENKKPDGSCSGWLPMVDLHWQKLQGWPPK